LKNIFNLLNHKFIMKVKFIILLSIFLLGSILSSGQEGEVNLIEPIIESPQMNERQAAIYSASQVFKNWGIQKLQLDSVMKQYTGKGVKVCVCDTGQPDHVKLKDKIKASKNFTSDASVFDGNGHSTHVSGIIAEIAPDAEILIAKVLTDEGSGTNSGVANGLTWCVDQGANFINLSLGGSNPSTSIKTSIDYAISKGVSIIAAAGNSGQSKEDNIGYPAKYDEVIAIGSINDKLDVSSFSSSGEEGDLVTPGEKILSTYKGNTYRVLSGTSMATPYASAVAALYYEKHQSNTALERVLELGSTDMLPEGFDRYSFWGHVEPIELFEFKTPPETNPPVEEEPKESKVELFLFIGIGVLVVLGLVFFYRRQYSKNDSSTQKEENESS